MLVISIQLFPIAKKVFVYAVEQCIIHFQGVKMPELMRITEVSLVTLTLQY